jgi:hypothetical protein
LAALESLEKRTGNSEFVFEPGVKAAGLAVFSWAPKHTFGGVERLNASTAESTDTTIDTGDPGQRKPEVVVLQQTA